MVSFLSNILVFPTIFYTGLLILVVIYWLNSIIGLTNFETIETNLETEIDVDVSDVSGLASWLTKFKLDGIPFTLTLSFIIFFSWIFCFFMVEVFIKDFDKEWVRVALGFWGIILSPVLAIPITAILLSPFKPIFRKLREEAKQPEANDFVGGIAIIRSGKVNQSHGSVELNDGGAGLVLQVRAKEPNRFQRGDSVILKEYQPANNTYLIRHST